MVPIYVLALATMLAFVWELSNRYLSSGLQLNLTEYGYVKWTIVKVIVSVATLLFLVLLELAFSGTETTDLQFCFSVASYYSLFLVSFVLFNYPLSRVPDNKYATVALVLSDFMCTTIYFIFCCTVAIVTLN